MSLQRSRMTSPDPVDPDAAASRAGGGEAGRPPSPKAAPVPALIAAGVAAGGLIAMSLPPWGLWPAGLAGIALLAGTPTDSARTRGLLGGFAGLVLFGVSLRWTIAFTGVGAALLVILQSSFLVLASILAPNGRRRLIGLPAALVLAEAFRHRWPLSGFPMSGIELGQATSPLRTVATWAGPLGIILVAALLSCLLVRVVVGPGTWPRVIAAAVALAVLGAGLLLPAEVGVSPTGSLRAAIVQGGGPRGIPAVTGDPDAPMRRHLAASQALRPGEQDLVLWPEDVVDVNGPLAGSQAQRTLENLAVRLRTVLVAGVVENVDDSPGPVRRFRNAAVAFGTDGRVVARYDKVIRVPFGEYVPWRGLVDRIADLSLIPREAVPGTGPPLLDTSVGQLGMMISFEGMFARRASAAVQAGGQILLLPTNSASYTIDDVADQQIAAAQLRALETGRAVLLASPSGRSAVVLANGQITRRAPFEASAVLDAVVPLRTGTTPYGRTGDLPVLIVAALLLGASWWRRDVTGSDRQPPWRRVPRMRRDPARLERRSPRSGRAPGATPDPS